MLLSGAENSPNHSQSYGRGDARVEDADRTMPTGNS